MSADTIDDRIEPPAKWVIESAEEELSCQYRRAADAMETLLRFTDTRDRRYDDWIDWAGIGEMGLVLRDLAHKIAGA